MLSGVTELNKAWALTEISLFMHASDQVARTSSPGVMRVGTAQRQPDRDVAPLAHVVEQIIDRAIPGWPREPNVATAKRWTHLREWASRAKAVIEREDELREMLGDGAPEMDAGRLHPWVWEAAAPFWRTGHPGQAVTQAAIRVNAETQAKVGRRNTGETDLFNQLFKVEPPKDGAPRLRLMENDGSKTFESIHRGARSLAEGLYAGVRNPGSHEVLGEVDEQVALEQLAAFSLLARWVDAATVETV
jgi:hypothetical protein